MTDNSADDLSLQFLTETVWELNRRVREGRALSVDIDALRALEVGARTPLLRKLAAEALENAVMNGWFDYIVNAEIQEGDQCGSSF